VLAFYNEIDPFAADWLEALIDAGHIAPGVVDRRPIQDLQPADLDGYGQIHLFAGIGAWSYALRLAGVPDDFPVWTGSCPCQPFSAAGKQKGTDDERHLWPHFYRLVRARQPSICFGEQVARKAGLAWLDLVSDDLERANYAVGAADLSACGVGAPHLRQRLYFVAVADSTKHGSNGRHLGLHREEPRETRVQGTPSELADACRPGPQGRDLRRDRRTQLPTGPSGMGSEGSWAPMDWVSCRDGRQRPIEPGTFPLVDGAAHLVGRLRGYGNAIVAPLAAEFIGAALDALGGVEC
jgi:DNA (cytosine-5)-methyltransferase 1